MKDQEPNFGSQEKEQGGEQSDPMPPAAPVAPIPAGSTTQEATDSPQRGHLRALWMTVADFVDDTQRPTQPIRPTRRAALFYTSINTFAAAGVAFLLCFLLGGLCALAGMVVWWVGGVLAVFVAVPVCYALLRSATFNTCRISPAAPLAVATGTGVGGGLLCSVLLVAALRDPGLLFFAANSAAIAAATFFGAKRGAYVGILERFGRPQKGIGATCARCEYDMRGLEEMVPCPECGYDLRFAWDTSHRPGH